jgi:hypothetical protein
VIRGGIGVLGCDCRREVDWLAAGTGWITFNSLLGFDCARRFSNSDAVVVSV